MNNLEDLTLDHLRCRTFGHAWEEFVPVGMRRPSFGWRFSLLCTSCSTERHELVDTHGGIAQREYRYPEGYGLDHRPDRAEARVLYNKRRVKKHLPKHRGHLKEVAS